MTVESSEPAREPSRGRPRGGTPEGRTRLLDAARVEFARAGYAASVADIVARAGVNAPTLYHHFESKEGIFGAAAAAAYAEVLETLRVASDPVDGDFGRSVRAILEASVGVIRDAPDLAALFLVIQFELPRQSALTAVLAPLLREFRRFFDDIAARPGAPAGDGYTGRALVALLNGLNTEALLLHSPARDYPRLVDAMLSLLAPTAGTGQEVDPEAVR